MLLVSLRLFSVVATLVSSLLLFEHGERRGYDRKWERAFVVRGSGVERS